MTLVTLWRKRKCCSEIIYPFSQDGFLILTLSKKKMLSDASAAHNLRKHCGRRRNCSKWSIFPFATMFSTLLNNCSFIYTLYRVSIFLTIYILCFQSSLLKICCKWERVWASNVPACCSIFSSDFLREDSFNSSIIQSSSLSWWLYFLSVKY